MRKIKFNKFKWFVNNYYGLIITLVFLLILVFVAGATVNRTRIDSQIVLAILGVLLSFVYFIQKQQIDEAKLFKELFVDFNKRYSELSVELNRIKGKTETEKLSEAETATLSEYFNLCAEEFLFYQKGYIYPEVWASWVAGMNIYFACPWINKLWKDEISSLSYYGLDVDKEIDLLFPTKRSLSKSSSQTGQVLAKVISVSADNSEPLKVVNHGDV